jgi:hypothetical protein
MKIHAKLQDARLKLQSKELKKTGHNKFPGYYYFELQDFLPDVQKIFAEVGLCGVVSYNSELATLTISEFEGDGQILITSPMASANLKACHDVQNLGAVETYERRYLWVTAMEIVEHDAIDSSEKQEGKQQINEIEEIIKNYKARISQAKTQKDIVLVWASIPEDLREDLREFANQKRESLKN